MFFNFRASGRSYTQMILVMWKTLFEVALRSGESFAFVSAVVRTTSFRLKSLFWRSLHAVFESASHYRRPTLHLRGISAP